jgi:UDP-N-acetylmuramoyl-tripeptide--D-alanyl-D-alanine ligase
MRLDLDFVISSMNGTLLTVDRTKWVEGVTTDSRQVKPGQVFFALSGDRFDGHDYINVALQAGAAAVVGSRREKLPAGQTSGAVILVQDTLVALQELAAKYRQLFAIPIVAVTGSVGKTTTKDMLADCLAANYQTLKTPDNFNNEIGLPLTLMSLEKNHGAAVVELGMRAPGEISHLARIVQPTYAIITNVEAVHLETMGSLENIVKAKCELLEYIAKDKFAMINGDNDLLVKTAQTYPNIKYTFGFNPNCDVQVLRVDLAGEGMKVTLRWWDRTDSFFFPIPAPKLASNLAAAAGTAYLMGLSPESIQDSLAGFRPSGNRLHITYLAAGGAVINDTYNANPVSMIAALEVCKDISSGRKTVAVLGDMLELGDYEVEGHLQVGKTVAALGLDMLVTIGPRAVYIGQGALLNGMPAERIKQYQSRDESLPGLISCAGPQDVVLFKASRGMGLEILVNDWLAAVNGGSH